MAKRSFDQGGVVLVVSDLTVTLGSRKILAHASLTVSTGDIVALQGASGSGKSTLLRAIAGLIPIDSGTIMSGDVSLHELPTHRRHIGLVFQDRVLFPHLDVAGNIGFGLKYTDLNRSARQTRITELLELIGLPTFSRRQVATLSGGEAQRVALARALAPKPRVLLLDEPLSALDVETKDRLTLDIRSALKAEAMTAIYVTHDVVEATRVADQVTTITDIMGD
jgi:thiamine transport system ATP-binding protein